MIDVREESVAGREAGGFGELFPEGTFRVVNLRRDLDSGDDEEIATRTFLAEPASAHAQPLAALRAGRNLDAYFALKGRNRNARPQRGFPRSEIEIVRKIFSFDAQVWMPGEANGQIQVA